MRSSGIGTYMKYNKLKSAFHFFKHTDKFPCGHEVYFGPRGSGKSTQIAKHYYQYLKDKKTPYKHFYANQEMQMGEKPFGYLDLNYFQLTDYLNPLDKVVAKHKLATKRSDGKIPPFYIEPYSIIEIDEVGVLYNSRNFKEFPKEINGFMKMIRKLHLKVIMYSQTYDCDKQLRQSADNLYIMKKIGLWTISRKIDKRVGIIEIKNADGSVQDQTEQGIGDIVKMSGVLSPGGLKVTFIPFYTDMFDSYG